MVISKRCDCGEMDRVLCQCAFFEEFIERDAWLEDVPDIEDVDYEWGESESTMESVSPQ